MSVGFRETEPQPLPLYRYVSTVTIAAAIFVAIGLAKVKDVDLDVSGVLTTIQQTREAGQDDLGRGEEAVERPDKPSRRVQ